MDDEENYLDQIVTGQHLQSADVASIMRLDINLKNTIFIITSLVSFRFRLKFVFNEKFHIKVANC
jgi:hypothetical protein